MNKALANLLIVLAILLVLVCTSGCGAEKQAIDNFFSSKVVCDANNSPNESTIGCVVVEAR